MPDKGTEQQSMRVESKGHSEEPYIGAGSKGGKAAAGSARNKLWAA